jgi:hypothetical protein
MNTMAQMPKQISSKKHVVLHVFDSAYLYLINN